MREELDAAGRPTALGAPLRPETPLVVGTALTLMVSVLTFGGTRANVLRGAVHLLLFFA